MTEVRVFADYSQIHVADEGAAENPGDLWGDHCVADGVSAVGSLLILRTAVPVEVSVGFRYCSEEPEGGCESFDHVVEASVNIPSGRLVICGPTDDLAHSAKFSVPGGWLRVRASRGNLVSAISADIDADMSDATIEKILLEVWVAARSDPRVIKRFAS
ncbi:hypothetical protein KVH15_35240 [Streptomyces olivaceus]|uniref:hypothetical protein n=1 Tax=Streptomyces olivaceus TaxID=47716 RepID=UPI001CCC7D31|nr:hypothetical protein [Streptomyces olivaceus]MBZ6086237.1 hypothetical protein [Streptomyces olivaceus]